MDKYDSKDYYNTTNLYLCAYLEGEGFKHIKIRRHPQKKMIWEYVYKKTDNLMGASDDFHDNDELQDFIQNHVNHTQKIKRKNREEME